MEQENEVMKRPTKQITHMGKRFFMLLGVIFLLVFLAVLIFYIKETDNSFFPEGTLSSESTDKDIVVPSMEGTKKIYTPTLGYSIYVGDEEVDRREDAYVSVISSRPQFGIGVYETGSSMEDTIRNQVVSDFSGVWMGVENKVDVVTKMEGYTGSIPTCYVAGSWSAKSQFSNNNGYFVSYYLQTGQGKNLLLFVNVAEKRLLAEAKEILDILQGSINVTPEMETLEVVNPTVVESELGGEKYTKTKALTICYTPLDEYIPETIHIVATCTNTSEEQVHVISATVEDEDGKVIATPVESDEFLDTPPFYYEYWEFARPESGDYFLRITTDKKLDDLSIQVFSDVEYEEYLELKNTPYGHS